MGMARTRETGLYGPVKQFFEDQGFAVRSEVKDCDLAAVRGDDMVLVEMKSHFNLTLVLQGIDRLQMCDTVYLAVDRAHCRRPLRRWRSIQRLCSELGLGLLTVDLMRQPVAVEMVVAPQSSGFRRNRRRRRDLLHEFHQRSGDYNVGGSTGQPIVTAYREHALLIARYVSEHQPAAVAEVRTGTGIYRSGTILQDNYYGWFVRVRRGSYTLSEGGVEALQAYAHVIHDLRIPWETHEPPEVTKAFDNSDKAVTMTVP